MGLKMDGAFSVTVDLNAVGPLTVDVACFGLDGVRKPDERYMTFFNQPATPCGAVKFAGQGKSDFDLARLPASIDALVMTVAIDALELCGSLVSQSLKNGSSGRGAVAIEYGMP